MFNMNEELIKFLKVLFEESILNRLPRNYGGGMIFSSPIIGVAQGDDPIFQKYKEIIAIEHLTPLELWLSEGFESLLPSNLRIISIVFPFSEKIREESKIISKNVNKKSQITLPAEIYCVGRNYANAFKKEICKKIIEFFKIKGFRAVAAMLSESFSILRPKKDMVYSTWSERHIAFATGLGTFSLHEGLITKIGCNIRLASVVTDAPLNLTLREYENPYTNCLYYSKGTCRKCEARCPANAIDENGHNKLKCYEYNRKIARIMFNRIRPILKPHTRRINWVTRPVSYPIGCAFCQFDVPCMDKNPMVEY
jgi:epoxyqueuosine reductase